MKISLSSRLGASLRRTVWVSSLGLALSAAWIGASASAQAAPGSKSMMTSRIGVAQAERIARNYVGRGAYVVRNEGVRNGMYSIHVHRNGVARHVFVGTRTGRVVKVRIINPRADRREDGR